MWVLKLVEDINVKDIIIGSTPTFLYFDLTEEMSLALGLKQIFELRVIYTVRKLSFLGSGSGNFKIARIYSPRVTARTSFQSSWHDQVRGLSSIQL